jgi:hypothetical protein
VGLRLEALYVEHESAWQCVAPPLPSRTHTHGLDRSAVLMGAVDAACAWFLCINSPGILKTCMAGVAVVVTAHQVSEVQTG